MLQLEILSGKKAGTHWVARRFPFQVGRASQSALVLDEPGVWDRHADFAIRPGEGITVSAAGDASLLVNGQPARHAVLRNGDLLEAGSVKLRFGLAPVRQRGLGVREGLTWIALAALYLGQVVLIYFLAE
jgi:hypothetical protein